MPPITVILPVLNGMPYLQEALTSLQAQTCRDFEVILWDNGSADGTVEEARRWIPSRLPGRVMTGKPLPLHLCLARLVEEAQTEFCARMDADDVCLPRRFEWQLGYLSTHPDTAVMGGQMDFIDSAGHFLSPAPRAPLDQAGILLGLLWRNPMPHPAVMFRREAVLSAGNYAVEKPVEDLDLWLRMASRDTGLANLSETVLFYRRHEASICHGQQQNGSLQKSIRECLAAHSAQLFHLKFSTHMALLNQTHPLAAWPLESALARIAQRTGLPVARLRQRTEYHQAGRMMTSRKDPLTRIYLRLLETRFQQE